MIKLSVIHKSVITGLLLFCSTLLRVSAATEPYQHTLQGRIKKGDTLVVKDEKFRNAAFNWSLIRNKTVDNIITFGFFRDTAGLPQKVFKCKLDLKVEYWSQPDQVDPITEDHVILEIGYDPAAGAVYQAERAHYFKNGHRVKITVNDITSAELGDELPPVFKLTNMVSIDRQYDRDPNATGGRHLFIIPPPTENTDNGAMRVQFTGAVEAGGELLVGWDDDLMDPSAEEFDLDWTFVDGNSPLGLQLANNPSSVSHEMFRNNFTRVTLTAARQYPITLVHQARFLLVRIRGAKKPVNGIRQTFPWEEVILLHELNNLWHQDNKNWQYNASYAEEGKKKEVISYADGALRGRQSVTVANPGVSSSIGTDKYAVVQETVYDEFGRPAMSILPAPLKQKELKYYPGLHLNNNLQPYTFTNMYGTSTASPGKPDPLFGGGASAYYSADNPFLNDAIAGIKFVPDAKKYPFSVTRYTPDNTGRIKVQGGVGELFQPGDNGKATMYFYGKPEAWELDRLFGNDVGYAHHYQKKMTIDPNGQIAISYENASGKVIATALTGTAPANLKPLESQPVVSSKTTPLLIPSQFRFDPARLTLTATANYMVSLPNQSFTVNYNIEQLIVRYSSSLSGNICSNCYYSLKITVSDDDGNIETVIAQPAVVGSELSNCNLDQPKAASFSYIPRKIGTYYIRFELGMSEDVIGAYTDDFIKRNKDLKTELQFLLEQLNKLNFKDCISDCKTCLGTLGEKANFVTRVREQLRANQIDIVTYGAQIDAWSDGMYGVLLAHCQNIRLQCSASPCAEYERLMIADVSPGGQYALFTATGAPLEPTINVILKHWRTVFDVRLKTDPVYQEKLIEREDGTFTSPHDADFSLELLLKYWNPAWGSLFLPYHPEQCALEFCTANAQYIRWDQRIKEDVQTAAQISSLQSGLQYLRNQADWLVNADPYFQAGANGAAEATSFRNKLLNYSQEIGITATPVKGLTQYVDYVLYCGDPNGSTNTSTDENNWANCTPDANCRIIGREWEMYRNIYVQLKEQLYQSKRNNGLCADKCKPGSPVATGNGCPKPASFSFYQQGDPSGGMKTVKVKFEGAMQWASLKLYLTVPAGYGNPGNELTITNLATFTWSVAQDMPLNEIIINRVECVSMPAVDVPCNGTGGTLSLSSGGKKTGDLTFTDQAGGSNLTYHIVKGYSDDQPILTDYCTGATATYYNCLKVSIGGAAPYQFFNVWVVTCTNIAGRGMNMAVNSMSVLSNDCGYSSSDFTMHNSSVWNGQFEAKIKLTGLPIPTNTKLLVVIEVLFTNSSAQYDYIEFTEADNGGDWRYGTLLIGGNSEDLVASAQIIQVICDEIEPTECDPLLLNKTPRFVDVVPNPYGGTTPGELSTQGLTGIQSQIDVNCAENAETWLLQMEDCLRERFPNEVDYKTRRLLLKAGFTAVCKLGGDPDHIYGASTAPPGRSVTVGSYTYTSFGDVIQQVLNVPVYTMTCNPWLIDGPYPYKAKVQGIVPTIANTSAGICDKLGKLIQDHSLNGGGISLYQFVKNRFGAGVNLTEAEFATLVKGCTNCRYLLEKNIDLPVFLDPGAKGCINFQEYNNAKAAFNTALGGSPDLSHENYGRMLATYMNHQWGFTMGYDQYKAYEDLLATQPSAGLCNQPAFAVKVSDDPLVCLMGLVNDAAQQAKYMYVQYIEEERRKFRKKYVEVCGNTKALATLVAPQQIYHYTLYYYNQAGQLIRTVPPEGVRPLSDEDVLKVQEARNGVVQACGEYAGPGLEADKQVVATDLNHVISNGPGALEFWLRSTGFGPLQVLQTSNGTRKYMFNTCLNGNYLNVDVYELIPNGSEVSVILTHHTAVNIQGVLPLKEWTHVVLQASNLLSDNLQVYVNGISCPAAPEAPASSCGFDLSVGPGGVTYPENYTALRHFRTYTSVLSAVNVGKLYANTCMTYDDAENEDPGNLRYSWAQFNVPPVEPGQGGPTSGISVKAIYPDHKMATSYAYNTLGQVVKQKSPDAGISNFWYDYLGRLILSQNAEQLAPAQENAVANRYSYTEYERLGRIKEVGEVLNPTLPGTPFLTESQYTGLMTGKTRRQVTRTYYDVKEPFISQPLENLRKRVVFTEYLEDGSVADQQTFYSYDAIGNVKSLWQKIKGLDIKQIDYNYDLASGKVNKVRYQQAGSNDRFIYGYEYDAENRLIKVDNGNGFMGSEGWDIVNKKTQALYKYLPHGPLARIELGEHSIQGIDYAYTLQGWLKGMNGNYLNTAQDMGMDAAPGDRVTFAADAMAFSLNYYNEDYSAVSVPSAFSLKYAPTATYDGNQLFNGNIAGTTLALSKLGNGAPVGYTYVYDQLNRLKHMRQQDVTSTWVPRTTPDMSPFMENISYDGNGNILNYERNGSGFSGKPLGMDNLSYTYQTIAGEKTNRLASVTDNVSGSAAYENDLEGTRSYSYDKIGNLIAETATGTDKIFWTVYGKISKVVKSDGSSLEYRYDAGGNRVSKTYVRPGQNTVTTWHVRDAQGNTLATYNEAQPGTVLWKEQHLYGSSRLGLWEPNMNVAAAETDVKWLLEGNKRYELTNHLGNVIAVLSDKKLGASDYKPEVISMQDYYPFGMAMEGRYGAIGADGNGNPAITGLASGYRYGFNGMEKSDEIKGEGNSYVTEFREYDSRVGRWLSIDNLGSRGPDLSPYNFSFNNPIIYNDPSGLWPWESSSVRSARQYAKKTGGTFEKWKKDGSTWASVSTTSIGDDGIATVNNRVFKPSAVNKAAMVGALAALARNKDAIAGIDALLEGTGVRLAEKGLSNMRFLGPAAAIASMPLFLQSDNPTRKEKMQQSDRVLSGHLEAGDLDAALDWIEHFNRKNPNNNIVFRYLSFGEFNNRIQPDEGFDMLAPFDRSGNLATKYITPDFYFSSSRATAKLALPTAPQIAIWTYESEILATKSPSGMGNYHKVKPKYEQPGGGLEAVILQPFPVHGFFPLIK